MSSPTSTVFPSPTSSAIKTRFSAGVSSTCRTKLTWCARVFTWRASSCRCGSSAKRKNARRRATLRRVREAQVSPSGRLASSLTWRCHRFDTLGVNSHVNDWNSRQLTVSPEASRRASQVEGQQSPFLVTPNNGKRQCVAGSPHYCRCRGRSHATALARRPHQGELEQKL